MSKEINIAIGCVMASGIDSQTKKEVIDSLRETESENSRLKAERDKAVEDMRKCRGNKCDYCYYSSKNQNTPCRDCQSPISNCGDKWKWRGLEELGWVNRSGYL